MVNPSDGGVQLSLLSGFVSRERAADPRSGVELASTLPVAAVIIDSPVPHLDRIFDYSVPASLDRLAQPGVRVKVKFGGQDLNGFIVERLKVSESDRLVPLSRVYSAVPVLAPQILQLARKVAARYAGTVADVLRVAVPPRVASLEKSYITAGESVEVTGVVVGSEQFSGYHFGQEFIAELIAGGSPKGVLQALTGYGPHSWHHQLGQAAAQCLVSGRGSIVVVPHLRDLEVLEQVFSEILPVGSFVKLTADDGPSQRYENFLKVLNGTVQIVIGTRSAAYAPVKNLGLVACWDDGDELHIERRAPYQHSRDVLLLRSEIEDTAVLMAGHARSLESQRLVSTGWAQSMVAERALARKVTPRVISTSDSFELERDPLAQLARLPHRAWETARIALASGPVLVQVARTGHTPALACQRCRELARCHHCTGPLMQSRAAGSTQLTLSCRWCGQVENHFTCSHCGNQSLRAVVVGASRTAEELGRAFPSVPIISSSGEHIKTRVGERPAIVVATVGAEPVATGGYSAALLLDGDSLLRRESLRSGEDTLRRWMDATALVRPAKDGGTVVVTADDSPEVRALVRWDPAGIAERELLQRVELGLPPAVRIASLTGTEHDVEAFVRSLQLPESVRVIGPAPLPGVRNGSAEDAPDYRSLLFFPYSIAGQITQSMRSLKASNAAGRIGAPVQVRCDGTDVI